jgi:ubiquinone/menaquinone biosynthesis C-methylase UbiE
MLPRVLETEAMDTLAEAVDYDTMDHSEVNRIFVADLLAAGPDPGLILDLGTGTAQIPIELCRQDRRAQVVAVDAAHWMVKVGRQNVQKAGLADRIWLQRVDAKRLPYRDGSFATVISNSIVHHVPKPRQVLEEAWRVAAPGGLVFFRDLFRPSDEETIRRLVNTYAAEANDHQRQMFADSFRASLTVEEIRQLVADLGHDPQSVEATSDRHWTWVARRT